MTDRVQQVWERLREGRHMLVVGGSIEPPDDATVCAVSVDCSRWERPLGPLFEARDKLEAMVQQTRAPILIGGMPSDALLRRELVEDDDGRGDRHLVGLANRLQRQVGMPVVLVFDAIDTADDVSLELLSRMVRDESGLHLAMLMSVRGSIRDCRSGVAEIIAALRERHGDDAIVDLVTPEAESEESPEDAEGPALDELALEVLRVLRAGATVGNIFEADVVAELLGLDTITSLELLQLAKDGGAPVHDLGDGVFRMPRTFGDRLRESITPSLASAWHRHLAFLLGAGEAEASSGESVGFEAFASDGPSELEPEGREGGEPFAMPGPVAATSRPSEDGEPLRILSRDPDRASRAAEHAEAAGERDAAAARYLQAATHAASLGAQARALELLQRCLSLLGAGPPTVERRRMRLRALLEMARIKWYAVGDGRESYSLDDALAVLDEARDLVRPDDPVELRAELAALRARVGYDIGGEGQLTEALERLDEAREALLDDGRPMDAARLLNDEAAIRVRLGEFERAAELLRRSRDVFSRHAESSEVARRELAETDLLVARLMLHAPEAHQRDPESLHWALESAHNAERAYQRMGDSRERARAWETLARLELLRHRADAAMQYLRSAVGVQEQLGDVVGLARTSGALAEVMADAGMYADALQLLTESITLNRMKGSRQGLAYNRTGLEELIGKLPPAQRRDLGGAIEELRGQL